MKRIIKLYESDVTALGVELQNTLKDYITGEVDFTDEDNITILVEHIKHEIYRLDRAKALMH